MLISELAQHVSDVNNAKTFLRQRRIIASLPPKCPDCPREMTEVKRKELKDGVVWRCPTHKRAKVSIRKGSFLEHSHLTLQQFIFVVYFWSHSMTVSSVSQMIGLSQRVMVDWFNFLRGVCTHWLTANPYRIGALEYVEMEDYVEDLWQHAKRKLKALNGSTDSMLTSYLDEFLWRQLNAANSAEAFEAILSHISEWYIVPH